MALPNPIPDNPLRWDGWKNYNSDDLYARLCLSYESNPSPDHRMDGSKNTRWWKPPGAADSAEEFVNPLQQGSAGPGESVPRRKAGASQRLHQGKAGLLRALTKRVTTLYR